MTANKTYHWRNLNFNQEYIEEIQENTTLINISGLNFTSFQHCNKINELTQRFISEHSNVRISNRFKKLIDDLLIEYNLNSNNEFYIISTVLQKDYIHYYNNAVDFKEPLVKDYQDAQKDLKILFDALRMKLDTGNVTLNSVKLDNKKPIKNFFVLTEVLENMIKAYGLTNENFEKTLNRELAKYVDYRMKDLDELYKWEISNELFNFIKSLNTTSDSSNLNIKFAGIFMLISQIPVLKKNRFEIPTSNDISKFMDSDLIKYLTGFIKRPKQFFFKK